MLHGCVIFPMLSFSHSVVSNSLWPHELQHIRPPCPSPTPGVYSNSCPSSPWCHPAISSSVVPFSTCPQSLPASESFPMTQLFAWDGLLEFSLSISPSNEHPALISFRMDWLDLLAVQGTLKCLLQHHSSKASILWRPAFFIVGEFLSCLGFRRILKIKLSLGKTMKNSLDLFRKQVLLR